MKYSQLVELTENRLPKIWLVNGTITGDRITFELGYLGDGYGAKNAILVASRKGDRIESYPQPLKICQHPNPAKIRENRIRQIICRVSKSNFVGIKLND